MDMTDMTRAAVSRRRFLQLAGAGMLALTGTALTGCGNSTSSESSDKGSKLAAIKSRGHLNAGVKKMFPATAITTPPRAALRAWKSICATRSPLPSLA